MVDLALSDSQQELQGVARRFLRSGSATWTDTADLGWLGLTIPVDYGGAGASAMDAGALYTELGRGPLPGPLFEAAVLAPAIMLAAAPAAFAPVVAAIAEGEAIVAPLLSATSAPPRTIDDVGLQLTDGRVRGQVTGVRLAAQAGQYLVMARNADRVACALVAASDDAVAARELPGFAPGQFEVTFDDAPVLDTAVLLDQSGLAAVGEAVVRALPVLCAFQVGSCQAVLDMTVAYSNDRVAFGKPIGTFQRVQDHVIEIVNALDAARWTTYHALWCADTGEGALAAAHVAKAVTSEAHARACTHSHEVHAGIGTDLQYGLAVHTHLARTLYSYYGDPYWHRQRLADELGLG
jgi:acyl-CoA dehydrogenase